MFVAVIWLKIATSELTIDWVMNFLRTFCNKIFTMSLIFCIDYTLVQKNSCRIATFVLKHINSQYRSDCQ